MVGNTPFRDYKHSVDEGGLRDPLIVSWPKVIRQHGAVRHQFVDVIDITPTVLAQAGVAAPATYAGVPQKPLEGASFAATFTDPQAPNPRATQYFELWGKRAIWHNGWQAMTIHKPGDSFDNDQWLLFNLDDDFSAATDVAARHPERVADMQKLWWDEAAKYNVLPLDESRQGQRGGGQQLPQQGVYTYYPSAGGLPYGTQPYGAAPETTNRSFAIEADIDRKDSGAQGVMLAMGDRFGGYVFYIMDNRLYFDCNDFGKHIVIASNVEVPTGKIKVGYVYRRTADFQGDASLLINGREVAKTRLATTPTVTTTWAGMDVGRDVGSPVSDAYAAHAEFEFPIGQLQKVVLRLEP
jgi:arylsulfatase